MTDTATHFQIVPEGYEPGQVDRRIAELVHATKTAQQHAHDLHLQLGELREQLTTAETDRDSALAEAESARASVPEPAAAPPDFASLGEHIGTILQAADEAAAHIRADGLEEIASARAASDAEIEANVAKAETQLAELTHHRNEVVSQLAQLRDSIRPVNATSAT